MFFLNWRDPDTRFSTFVFFIKQLLLGPWYRLKPFWIWLRIYGVDRQSWLHSVVIDTAVTCTVESLTPLWNAQRSQWHRCDMHSGVIDTAVTCTAVSWKPLCNNIVKLSFSRMILNTTVFLCVNMIRLHRAQRCHWQCCDMHSGVIDTAVTCKTKSLHRCDFGPHIRMDLANFKGNIYRKNIHRQIDLYTTVHL
jgi:hypothetical protein